MIEYVIQRDGEKKVAIGIRGDDKSEIIHHYWGFWNHEATSGQDLIWSNEYVKPYLGYSVSYTHLTLPTKRIV